MQDPSSPNPDRARGPTGAWPRARASAVARARAGGLDWRVKLPGVSAPPWAALPDPRRPPARHPHHGPNAVWPARCHKTIRPPAPPQSRVRPSFSFRPTPSSLSPHPLDLPSGRASIGTADCAPDPPRPSSFFSLLLSSPGSWASRAHRFSFSYLPGAPPRPNAPRPPP